jgi:thiopeptide-type bacteriocin biosynthesis protein
MNQKKDAARLNSEKETTPLYAPASFYLLRTPTFSVHMLAPFFDSSLAPGKEEEDLQNNITEAFEQTCQRGYAIVRDLLTQSPLLKTALRVASCDIQEGIARLQSGEGVEHDARTKRAYSRILRYIVRMCSRPTPFGLFAGVGLGQWHAHTDLTLGDPTIHHRLRPDMGWLLALIQTLEQDEKLLPHLQLMRNATAYVAGSRLILPSLDIYGTTDNSSLSLRYVPVVQSIVSKTQSPISYTQLVEDVIQELPGVTTEQIEQVLFQLWQAHVLLSTLRPPFTNPEPTAFVLNQIRAIPAMQEVHQQLAALLQTISDVNQQELDGLARQIEEIVARQQTLAPTYIHLPIQVDAALYMQTAGVHHQVAEVAAKAAELLLCMGTHPRGEAALNHYRAAFMQKYGSAEVPLLHLLSTEKGLGPPSTYQQPPREYPLPQPIQAPDVQDSARERTLCSLMAHAFHTQSLEVALTDTLLQDLFQWEPSASQEAPALLDLYFQIQATSRNEIDQGRFRLVVTGITFGGRTMGRFADLLGGDGRAHLQAYMHEEEGLSPDVIFADLTYLPTEARCGNVSLCPPLHRYEIAVNTMPSRPPDHVIPLDDLVVSVRKNRFCLRSLRLGKEVKVSQGNMLSTRFAPNVCRFLIDISHDALPYPEPFDWGNLRHSPFLPRVSYGQIVLSPARWTLRLADIEPAAEGSEAIRWFLGLQRWRQRWNVPRYVYLTHLDQRLLLDLEHPLLAQELHTELKRDRHAGASILLQEMLPDMTQLWLQDSNGAPYCAEFVAPLRLRKPSRKGSQEEQKTAQPQMHDPRAARTRTIDNHERISRPGDAWLYLKLNAPVICHDELIAGPIRELVNTLRMEHQIRHWFFIRYDAPEPHLRVRFLAGEEAKQEHILCEVLTWAHQLTHDSVSFSIDTYEREVERYGGPQMMNEIERAFSVNSDALSAVIASSLAREISLDPLIIGVFSLDHFCRCWSLDFSARLRFAQRAAEKYESIDAFRAHRELLSEFLVPWRWPEDMPAMQERKHIASLLAVQETVLPPIARQMQDLAQQELLWETPENILGSLMHMHLNRLGFDNAQEQQIYAFWRHTLECLQRRPDFIGQKSRHATRGSQKTST